MNEHFMAGFQKEAALNFKKLLFDLPKEVISKGSKALYSNSPQKNLQELTGIAHKLTKANPADLKKAFLKTFSKKKKDAVLSGKYR